MHFIAATGGRAADIKMVRYDIEAERMSFFEDRLFQKFIGSRRTFAHEFFKLQIAEIYGDQQDADHQ